MSEQVSCVTAELIVIFVAIAVLGFYAALNIIGDFINVNKLRKNVLKAIKDLGIEDELAKRPAIYAEHYNAIKTYLWEHRMPDPFVGRGSALDMDLLITELRDKGKIKQLEPVKRILR